MKLGWESQFRDIVVPAWQAYLASESALTKVATAEDNDASRAAALVALREGGAASMYLHHFAEVVFAEPPEWLPQLDSLAETQQWLACFCTSLRSEAPSNDVGLLRDVADALKHSHLRNQTRDVAARDAVLVVETGYSDLPFGEGKFGGVDQVIVLAKSGKRPLSAVLQNVIDAWRRAMNWPLPGINDP